MDLPSLHCLSAVLVLAAMGVVVVIDMWMTCSKLTNQEHIDDGSLKYFCFFFVGLSPDSRFIALHTVPALAAVLGMNCVLQIDCFVNTDCKHACIC